MLRKGKSVAVPLSPTPNEVINNNSNNKRDFVMSFNNNSSSNAQQPMIPANTLLPINAPAIPGATESVNGAASKTVQILLVLAVIVIAVGATMSWALFFKSYESEFNALRAMDTLLDQEIYNEMTTRLNKDMALMQEQARQRAAFERNVQERIEQQNYVNTSLILDIEERISGDQNISNLIGNETQERINADTLLQERIDNATATLAIIKAFQVYSDQQFMTLMQNISDLDTDLIAEINARAAKQALITSQQLIIETALVSLVNELNQEMMERIAKDDNLTELVNLATYGIIRSFNGLTPVGGLIYVVSNDTVVLEILNGTMSNEIVVVNHGLYSFSDGGIFNIAFPDVNHNMYFTASHGFHIENDPVNHTIKINSTFASGQTASNYVRLSATIPHGTDWAAYTIFTARQGVASLPGQTAPQIDDPSSPAGNGFFLAIPLSNVEKGSLWPAGTSSVTLRYGNPGGCMTNSQCQCIGPGCPTSYFVTTAPADWFCRDHPDGNVCSAYCNLAFGFFECVSNYGLGWYCAATQDSPPGKGQCIQFGTAQICNPAFCNLNPLLGSQWGCINDPFTGGLFCEQLYCFYDSDCSNKYWPYGYYTFCVNGRCVPSSKFDGDNYPYEPSVVNAPIAGYGNYPFPPPGYTAAYPGYASPVLSQNANFIQIIGNKPLYPNAGPFPDSMNITCSSAKDCPPDSVCISGNCTRGFFDTWDGQNHGFRIPLDAFNSTWMIKVTLTIRVLFSHAHTNQNHFFKLYVDQGNGGWEQKAETYYGAVNGYQAVANIAAAQFPPSFFDPFWFSPYVSLSTIVYMTTDGPNGVPVGTPLYVGWGVNTYWNCNIQNTAQFCYQPLFAYSIKSWAPWYRIQYEAIKIG